jgi:TonB-linked SusC/RagA family outer membrane protein
MNIRILFKKGANFSFVLALFIVSMMSTEIWAQKITTVSGTVIDASGITIPGVNIVEKGTTNSVSTDLDGKFSFSVAGSKSELVFSYLGYETFSQVVGQKRTFSIVLKNSAAKLDEVVVIGYGTSKKSDLTGSVATISGADLKKLSIANVAETLTGRLAGVQVTSAEGSPDSEVQIKIRGSGSLTQDSSPLLIVDGFPVNSISDISPSDIENITVLKDASSTAIYGSRGSNGVVIITTKSGKDNTKIAVSFNVFRGAKRIAKTIDVMQPEDFAKWQYEYALLKNDVNSYEQYFGPWADYNQYVGQKGTNWQKEIYGRLGEVISQDLGVRGGSDKMNFNFNYAHYDEKAIMVGSNFVRNNLSLSLKNKASKKVDLTFTMRYSDTKIDGAGANEQKEVSSADARLRHSVGYAPIPLDGLTTDDTDEAVAGYLVNPFVAVADNGRKQLRKNFNMLTSFSWKIIDNLQFKTDLGLDNYNYLDYRFYGRSTYYVNNVPAPENQRVPSLIISDRKDLRYRNANTLNYDFKNLIGSKHRLKLLLGEEMINYKSNEVTSTIQGFPKFFNFDSAINLSTQGKPQSVNNYYYPDDNLMSFFGRLNYDLKNRYLFTATYRADGSSKFLGKNRWGYFPSAAFAWKITEEDFLKKATWINSLKIRLSYGESGNNNIPTGQTVQLFQSIPTAWINNIANYWSASNIMANPDLKWETTVTQNIGLDYDLFKGRVSGSIEMYKNKTKDLLILFPTPGTGYTNQYRNMGEIQNTGVEASLNLVAIEKPNYGLNFSFNIGANKNRINSLGVMNDFKVATNWASTAIGADYLVNVGEPIGLMYGYQNDGRYEVSDFDYSGGIYTLKSTVPNSSYVVGPIAPGSMKLKDIDGDGLVNTKDLSVIGNSNPKHTGGMVINANAYGFDLSAAFNWSYGNDVYNANKIEFTSATASPNGQYRNLSTMMGDGTRWTNLDPASGALVTDPTALTQINANTSMWSPNMSRYVMSDWAVEDGSFLRLNSLTLGYTIPKSIVAKLGITNMKIYATGNNVFIITKYSGLDPEVSTRRATPLTPGVDYSPYPRSRQVVFGLNLTF